MVIGIDINIGYASGYAVYIYMQKTIRFLRYAAGYAARDAARDAV